jgi:O-antigen/teichoic acid export membrane protein
MILTQKLLNLKPDFRALLEKAFSTDFFRNSLILLTGTVAAQIIPVLMQLFLRRVFSPEQFGAFSVYMSILGILSIIVTLRYEMAIVLPDDNTDAVNLLGLTIGLSFIFNIVLAVVIFLFHLPIIHVFNFPEKYGLFLYFIPPGVFLFSSYQAINYWLIRIKAFKASSINKVSRRAAEGVVQIIFGIVKLPVGLVMADLFGNLVNNLSGINQLLKHNIEFKSIRINRIFLLWKRYIHFPKYNLLPAVLDTFTLAMPIFLINKFFSSTCAGFVDLTQLAIVAPLSIISATISQVLLQKISEKRQANQPILRNVVSLSIVLFSIAFIVLLVIQLWSTSLFQFVFGDKWIISGQIAKILVLSYSIRFIVSPLSIIFIALEKIRTQAFWQIFYFLLIGSLIFYSDFEFNKFLKLYVIFEVIAYLLYYTIIIKISRDYDRNLKCVALAE